MVSHLRPTKCFIEVLDAFLRNEYIRRRWMDGVNLHNILIDCRCLAAETYQQLISSMRPKSIWELSTSFRVAASATSAVAAARCVFTGFVWISNRWKAAWQRVGVSGWGWGGIETTCCELATWLRRCAWDEKQLLIKRATWNALKS